MFILLLDSDDILELTAEQLRFIPKTILLRHFSRYVDRVWEKLSEYIKADTEVRRYRRCLEHYNRPWQRTHIDGPAPLIKDCSECNSRSGTVDATATGRIAASQSSDGRSRFVPRALQTWKRRIFDEKKSER
ncbi:hypothetical protein ACFW04_014322 [Cataglyphis niger]